MYFPRGILYLADTCLIRGNLFTDTKYNIFFYLKEKEIFEKRFDY